MRFTINSNGDYYQILQELHCPFGEKGHFIIIKGDQIMYWQNDNNYHRDMKLTVEEMRSHIIDIEIHKWRNKERKTKILEFLRDTLAKMIAYEREIKIDTLLDTSLDWGHLYYC